MSSVGSISIQEQDTNHCSWPEPVRRERDREDHYILYQKHTCGRWKRRGGGGGAKAWGEKDLKRRKGKEKSLKLCPPNIDLHYISSASSIKNV